MTEISHEDFIDFSDKHPLRRFTTSELITELCKREGVSVAEWEKDRILLVKENEI